jgi:hypothetical protein
LLDGLVSQSMRESHRSFQCVLRNISCSGLPLFYEACLPLAVCQLCSTGHLHITYESPIIPFKVRLAKHLWFWSSLVFRPMFGTSWLSVALDGSLAQWVTQYYVPTVRFKTHCRLQGAFVLLNLSCYGSPLAQYIQVCNDIRTYNPDIVAPNAIMPRYS